jgi:AraC-like DNA-binding protein
LAKIAVELDEALARRRAAGTPGRMMSRTLAAGTGWSASDVLCTSGPSDRPFEEEHSGFAIAVVVAGTFQYRSPAGRALMTPGSILLGGPQQCFECGHAHGEGDRCVSFSYTPDFIGSIAADAGIRFDRDGFSVPRLPPTAALAPLVARATAGALGTVEPGWEEFALVLAAAVIGMSGGSPRRCVRQLANAELRVTRVVRLIERHTEARLTLGALAREAGLSPYHFLRTFYALTGVTPHQYVMRVRLRNAAVQLRSVPAPIIDIALQSGFGDVSNFNRAFRAEFGINPREYRRSRRSPSGISDRSLARGNPGSTGENSSRPARSCEKPRRLKTC